MSASTLATWSFGMLLHWLRAPGRCGGGPGVGRGAVSSPTSGQVDGLDLSASWVRGSGCGSAPGRDCRLSPREGRGGEGLPGELCGAGRRRGTSCATLWSARHSGETKRETAPHETEPTLLRSPGTELLLEETAESQGRQRRTSPDPYQGEGRVWAFTTHPPIPILGQNLGATELLDKHCPQRWARVFSCAVTQFSRIKSEHTTKTQPTICLVSPLALPALPNKRTLRLITS